MINIKAFCTYIILAFVALLSPDTAEKIVMEAVGEFQGKGDDNY